MSCAEIVFCKCSGRWKIRNSQGFLKLLARGFALTWTPCKRATGFRLKSEAETTARQFALGA